MEILFLLGGLLFGFLGLYLIWDHLRFLATARTVRGTVTAVEKRTTPPDEKRKQGGPIYYPVIRYYADGRERSFTSSYGMSMPQYDIGESLPVVYSRNREEARIKQKTPYIFGGILASIGIGMCVLFFHVFRFSLISVSMAAVVVVSIFFSARKELRKHDISTLDELQEALRNTRMKTRKGTEPEEAQLITDKKKLQGDMYRMSKSLRWIGPVFTVIGIAIVILGIYLGKKRAAFLEVAQAGRGEVVSINSRSSDDGYVYYPVVSYSPPGSSGPITFEHDVGSNPPSYDVGDRVEVLYHPDDPARAIIDAGVMNWFGPGLALLLGVTFTAGGIYSINYWRKLKKSKKFLSE